ncbi:MAG: hypothetical protein ACLQVD_04280 [Capsulimonadaceae bacterium]
MNFRVAVRPNARVFRALKLVQYGGATVDTAHRAWKDPWRVRPAHVRP